MKINIEYEFLEITGLVLDTKGRYWRLPFTGANGKLYPLKEIKPTYDRNYTAIRFKGIRYSTKALFDQRAGVEYTLEK
jgi:hypothetical protein